MPFRRTEYAPVGQYQPFHISAAQATAAPIGALVNTTSTTAIAAPGSATVTVADSKSVPNMRVGMVLVIYGGIGTAEEVQVTATNPAANQFTAVFANTHSGTYNITSKTGVSLGRVIINGAGSAMTLTLSNGNPAISAPNAPNYGPIAAISPVAGATYDFEVTADYGLYFTYAGTTAGDVTVTYLSQPV